MRIDHVIAPRDLFETTRKGCLISCESSPSMFGSDHKAIMATISNTTSELTHIAHDAITTIEDDDITIVATPAPARILATPVTPATR
jgi:hypothetical protein